MPFGVLPGSPQFEEQLSAWLEAHETDDAEGARVLLANLPRDESPGAAGGAGEIIAREVVDRLLPWTCAPVRIEGEGEGAGRGAFKDPGAPRANGSFDLAATLRSIDAPRQLEAPYLLLERAGGGGGDGGDGGGGDEGTSTGGSEGGCSSGGGGDAERRQSNGRRDPMRAAKAAAAKEKEEAAAPSAPSESVPVWLRPLRLHLVSRRTAAALRKQGTSAQLVELRAEVKMTSIKDADILARARAPMARSYVLSTELTFRSDAHGLLIVTVHIMTATPQIVVLGHSGTAIEELGLARGGQCFKKTTAWNGVERDRATAEYDHIVNLLGPYGGTHAAVLAVIDIDDGPVAPQPSGSAPSSPSPPPPSPSPAPTAPPRPAPRRAPPPRTPSRRTATTSRARARSPRSCELRSSALGWHFGSFFACKPVVRRVTRVSLG